MSEKKVIEVLPAVREVAVAAADLPHNRYHRAARSSAAMGIVFAAMSGMELIKERKIIPHGEWDKWIEVNCEFNRVTAWRYMELADKLKKRLQMFNALNICGKDADNQEDAKAENEARTSLCRLLERPASELLPEETEKLLADLRKATKGETLRQLYFDFGLISVDKPKGGAREHPEKILPPGETWEHITAVEVWSEVMHKIHEDLTRMHMIYFMNLSELKNISMQLLDARRAVDDLIKKG